MIKSDKRLLESLAKKYGVRGLNKTIQRINEAGHMSGKFDDGSSSGPPAVAARYAAEERTDDCGACYFAVR